MEGSLMFKAWIFLAIFVFGAVSSKAQAGNPLAPVKLESPRDTMQTFMDAMNDYRRGMESSDAQLKKRILAAIRTLNLENTPLVIRDQKGRDAAIFLKEVIDRVIVVDYSLIPDTEDRKHWRLKGTEIILLKIQKGDGQEAYLFSPETVYRAKEFYTKVSHLPYKKGSGKGALYKQPWLERSIPTWAKNTTLLLPNWQWFAILLAIFVGLLLKTLTQFSLDFMVKLAEKSKNRWDDQVILAIEKPAGLLVASFFWFACVFFLGFEGKTLTILTIGVQIILGISLIWTVYRLTDVLTDYIKSVVAKTESTLDDQLVPLIRKTLRIFVVVFGVLIVFQNLGFNVMSILAGLGLGGLAFALAAKDACANLFGSIMIFLDRPFKVGDWIVTNDVEGTVEEVGFRSTRIRTFYNSLVSVPNGTLATTNIDNMGHRKYRRIKAVLGLTYDTPAEKMEAFVEGIKDIIKNHPNTRKDYYHVVFTSYGDFSLNVLLYCFLLVPDWATELVERQNIYLDILRLAKKVGVEFAFPTQTLHVDSFPEKLPSI